MVTEVDGIIKILSSLGEKFNEANEAHAANYSAIALLLIDKGIITQEEFDHARLVTTHIAEQEFARKRDEATNLLLKELGQ